MLHAHYEISHKWSSGKFFFFAKWPRDGFIKSKEAKIKEGIKEKRKRDIQE